MIKNKFQDLAPGRAVKILTPAVEARKENRNNITKTQMQQR